jgi:hypothetical protein
MPPESAAEAAQLLTREVRTAPTLVKYAQPSDYEIQTRAELAEAAARTAENISPLPSRRWSILSSD